MGKEPLSVISMPIGITSKPERSPTKQTQIERLYRSSFASLGDLHCLLREQTSFDLDKVPISGCIWKPGVLTVLESLGQWNRVEFMVGRAIERSAVRNGTARRRQSKGCALVKPL